MLASSARLARHARLRSSFPATSVRASTATPTRSNATTTSAERAKHLTSPGTALTSTLSTKTPTGTSRVAKMAACSQANLCSVRVSSWRTRHDSTRSRRFCSSQSRSSQDKAISGRGRVTDATVSIKLIGRWVPWIMTQS